MAVTVTARQTTAAKTSDNAAADFALAIKRAEASGTSSEEATNQLRADLKAGKFDRVADLLSKGADKAVLNENIEGSGGRTALHMAVLHAAPIDVFTTLIDNGADLLHSDEAGETPFQLAAHLIKSGSYGTDSHMARIRDALADKASKQADAAVAKGDNALATKLIGSAGATALIGQEYENHMNELASSIAGSVDVDKRTLDYLTDSKNADNFKYLIDYKLREQTKDGKSQNVGEALKEVEDLLWSRIQLAAKNSGQDPDKVIDVVNGYWDRHAGSNDAKDLAIAAYGNDVSQYGPKTDNPNFEDNLNALAGLLVGGTLAGARVLAVGLDDDTATKLYANLIKAKLDQQGSPLNLDQAMKEVNDTLFDRIGDVADKSGAGEDAVVDVIKGYWNHHSGKEEADTIARKAYEEFQTDNPPSAEESSQVNPNASFDDEVNAVAAALAAGTFGGAASSLKNDNIPDHYATLVYLALKKQAADGKPVDLDAAYKEVKDDVWGRLGNALRDDPKASDKLDALDKYWDEGKGRSNAADVAREAYSQFLKDTVQTNNPNYEDNLNALALGVGGGAIGDTRTLSPLTDPTLAALYKNMVKDKLGKGVDLDTATKQVHDDLFDRMPHALRDHTDGSGKIDIVQGYWDRHGGQIDATRLSEDAYNEYVSTPGGGDKNLLAPSATDIMSAKTVDGRTVQELYLEKLHKAYENEPADSDKRKFLRLVDAKAMLGGGYKYLPYAQDDKKNQAYYSDNPANITPEEAKGLLNEEELDKQFAELAAKPDIAADNEKFLKEAVGEIKDKQGLEDRIVATMLSPTYEKDVAALGDKAQERYASDLRSLYLLNPEKATGIQQTLNYKGAFKQVNDLLADPSKLTSDSIKASARDIGDTFARAEVLGFFAGDAASRLYIAWDDWRSGRVANLNDLRFGDGSALTTEEKASLNLAKSTSDTMTDILTKRIEAARANPGTGTSWMANITDELKLPEIQAAMEYAGVPDVNRTKITELMTKANTNGAITTAGGLACLVAAVVQLTKDGGQNLTTEDRLGAAFYLLFTGSGITEATSQVTGALEKLLKLPGMKEAIGLDKNAANVWAPATETTTENSRIWKSVNKFVETKVGAAVAAEYNKLPESARNFLNSSVDRISKTLGPGINALSATDKLKLIGPGLKVLGALAYGAGSIIGIYLGIDGLIKAKTPEEKALAGLGLGAGIAWTGAAGIGLAAAFNITFAASSTIAVGLGAVGCVLSVIGLAIASAVKYAKQQKAAGEVRDYFTALSKDGVLEPDWNTKLNYLIHVQYLYNSKKINPEWHKLYFPDNMAPWEAQPDQYKAFTEANKKGNATIDWWFPASDPSKGLLKPHGTAPDHLSFVKPGYKTWTEFGDEGRGPK